MGNISRNFVLVLPAKFAKNPRNSFLIITSTIKTIAANKTSNTNMFKNFAVESDKDQSEKIL